MILETYRIHHVYIGEYYVEVFSEFRKPPLFKSAQWHSHQDNEPVHNSILVTVRHPPYCADLAPCNFWLFPKLRSEAVVMRQLRRYWQPISFYFTLIAFTYIYLSIYLSQSVHIYLSNHDEGY